jgi:hypothetical protein
MNFKDHNDNSSSCSSFSDVASIASVENHLPHDHMELTNSTYSGECTSCVECTNDKHIRHDASIIQHYHMLLRKGKSVLRSIRLMRQDWDSVIRFINSLSSSMLNLLHTAILDYLNRNGYDESKHYKYARISSGSPITVELQLYVTLWLLSVVSYLDMICMVCS